MTPKYKTKNWKFDAFCYGSDSPKPEWWTTAVKTGKAFEYAKTKDSPAYAGFGDKRSSHKAFVGDWIVLDIFGRMDVYSERNYEQRSELLKDEKTLDKASCPC